jgi:transcriptional regulator with XRE-family HTH domain
MTVQKSPSKDQAEIGARLKILRSNRGLSLRTLAKLSGVTCGALSQIENGRTSPSVGTLKNVLAAFGLSLGDFFVNPTGASAASKYIYAHRDLVNVSPVPGVKYLNLPGSQERRQMQLFYELYDPAASTGARLYSHAGEEGGFCIAGTIELTVAGEKLVLKPGDAYYFNSARPHRFKNIGAVTAKIVSVCTPPSF